MGKMTLLSRARVLTLPDEDFFDQKILTYEETCSFDDNDIESLKTGGAFPAETIFKPFNAHAQPNFVSHTWVCFPEYPFSLGLTYPFSSIVSEFFEVTKNILYSNHACDLDEPILD